MADFEKSEKLTTGYKYFNISVIWIFYYRFVLRILYYLQIPHEAVTLLSLICGFVSAGLFYKENLLMAAIFLHLKDIFDACDGALARLTGRGHLLGRYMDSIGDFLVLTSVVGAIALRQVHSGMNEYYFWGGATILSIFIQCSFFNYYQLSYLDHFKIDRLISKRDESKRDDINEINRTKPYLVAVQILKFIYMIIYGWQDRLVFNVDKALLKFGRIKNMDHWYGSSGAMSLLSPLCFGTHIFIFIFCTLLGNYALALKIIPIYMNIYLVLYLLGKLLFSVRVNRSKY